MVGQPQQLQQRLSDQPEHEGHYLLVLASDRSALQAHPPLARDSKLGVYGAPQLLAVLPPAFSYGALQSLPRHAWALAGH